MTIFFEKFVGILKKYYLAVFAGFLILTAASVPRTIELFKHISTDTVDLLPVKFPEVKAILNIRDTFKPSSSLALIFESENPEHTKQMMLHVAELLRKNPIVKEVNTQKRGWHFFDQHKLLFLELNDLKDIHDRIDRRIQKEKISKFYVDFEEDEKVSSEELGFGDLEKKYRDRYGDSADSEYYASKDGKIYVCDVVAKNSDTSLNAVKDFEQNLRDFISTVDLKSFDPTMKIYIHGSAQIREYNTLIKDLALAGIISCFLIFLPLLFRFRNPLKVLLIFIPLPVGLSISFSLVSFWIPKLNVSTSFLFAILGGLGVESGIHIFSRYYEMRSSGKSVDEALLDIYLHTGRSILTSVASVAVTFLLLVFADFRGFSEFGLISGVGFWVLFIVYFTFFPAIILLAERLRILKNQLTSEEPIFPDLQISKKWMNISLIFFVLLTIVSFFATPKVGFEYDSKKTRSVIPEENEGEAKYRKTNTTVNTPAIVIINGRDEADSIKAEIERRRDTNPGTVIEGVKSYYDILPKQQTEKMVVIKDIQRLLSDHTLKLVKGKQQEDLDRFRKALNETKTFHEEDIPQEIKDGFKAGETGQLIFVTAKPNLEMDNGQNAMRFAEQVREIKTPHGTFYPTNSAVIFGTLLKTIFKDSKKVLIISLLSVFFFVYIDFRNLKKSAIVMSSILAGVFWMFGVMYFAGMKFNFYNMVIVPAVMGMSIDNSIHIYHRYEELGRGSLSKVLSTTGLASVLASLTNASGFIGLLFCHHRGLSSMGLLAVTGLFTCLVSTLVFLPLFLQFLEKFSSDR